MSKYLSSLHSKRYSLIRWVSIIEIFGLQAIDAGVSNNPTINPNDILSAFMAQSKQTMNPNDILSTFMSQFFAQNQQGSSSSNNPSKNQEAFSFPIPNNNQNSNNGGNSFPSLPFNFSGNSSQTPLKLSSTSSPSQQTVRFDSLPMPLQQIYYSLIMMITDSKTTPQKIDEMIAQIPPPYKDTFLFIVNNQDQNLLHYCCGAPQPSPALFSYLIKKLQPIDAMNRPDSRNITPLNLLFTHKNFDLVAEFVKTLTKDANSKTEPINKIFQACFDVLKQNSQDLNALISDLKNLIKSQFLSPQAGKISKDEFAFLKNIFSMLEAQNKDAIKSLISSDLNNPPLLSLAVQQEKIDLANFLISYIHDLDENELRTISNQLTQYIIKKSNENSLQVSVNDPLFQLIHSLIKKCEPSSLIPTVRTLIECQFLNPQIKEPSKDTFNFLKNMLSILEEQDQDAIDTLLSPDSKNPSLFTLAIKEGKFDFANLLISYIHYFEENELNSVLNELDQYITHKLNNKSKLSRNDPLFPLINSLIKKCEPDSLISAFRTLIESQFLNPQIKEISNDKLTFLKCILFTLEKQNQETQDKDTIEKLFAPDSNDVSFLALAIQQEKIDFAKFLLNYRSHLDEVEVNDVLEQLNEYIIRKSDSNNSKTLISSALSQLIDSIIKKCEPFKSFPSNFMHTLVQYVPVQQFHTIIRSFPSDAVKALLFETNENGETPFEVVAFEQQDVAKLKILLESFIEDYQDTNSNYRQNNNGYQQCFEIKNKKGEHFLQALAYNDNNLKKLKELFDLFPNDVKSSAVLALNTRDQDMFDIAMESKALDIFKYLFQITTPVGEKLFEWIESDENNFIIPLMQDKSKRFMSPSYLNSLLDENGNSLLHRAAKSAALTNVLTLIQLGANVTLKNQDGQNPIRVLIQQMNTHSNNKQIKKGKKKTNNKNFNPIDLLSQILNKVAFRLKSPNGEEDAFKDFIDEQDLETGNTLLHEILELPLSPQIIKLLKNHHADFTIQNINGETPLDIALRTQNKNIIRLIPTPEDA